MFNIGEVLLISELQIRFAFPITGIQYPDYIKQREKAEFAL